MRGCTLDLVRPLPNCFRTLNLVILNPDQQVPIYCEWVQVQTTCLSTSTRGQDWGLIYGSKVQSITVSSDLDSLLLGCTGNRYMHGVCLAQSYYLGESGFNHLLNWCNAVDDGTYILDQESHFSIDTS